jgi:signal transduction histidine kinase
MRQLVDQLLDLSRLEANAIRIQIERFPVRRRLEELVFLTAPDRASEVSFDVEPELEVDADPAAFDRIVSNLLTNAFRYGEPPVMIEAEQRDRHFRLAVEDRGRGVSPDFAPQLFERFTRSEPSRGAVKGAGLGLSIAQSFAQAHGGQLMYEPAAPTGARFLLVLPRERSQHLA